jgi:phage terminase large subunit
MPSISIPNEWAPRPHQVGLFKAYDAGTKRFCVVWHRRAGKDSTVLNLSAKAMLERVGTYWHLFPYQTQARKAIWNGIDSKGRKILDQVFPQEIRKRTSSQEMLIELVNGSTWQLAGSDNYDSLVGSNPVGVVFSEWSLCDPNAWAYIRPILAENDGWASFIYTPRGKNHGYSLYNMARKSDDWYCENLTVNDTKREDGSPVITHEIIDQERAEGMEEALIQQEFYGSFESQIAGAYYADQISAAKDQGRIGRLPIEPSLPVHTAWDLGIADAMSIWLFQSVGKEIRLVHYYEATGKGMEHYIQYLNQWANTNGVMLGTHLAPHDIEVRELTSGRSRKDVARQMGIAFRTVQRPRVKAEGIQAVRRMFPRFWIDDERAEQGYNCVASYRREWDEKAGRFRDNPVHDWASHGADALQTLALGWRESLSPAHMQRAPQTAKVNFNVFG